MKQYYKKGLILVYPGEQNEAKLYQYNRLIEEFEKQGIEIDKLKVDEIILGVEDGKANLSVNKYDFCIQLVKDRYINALLEKSEIRAFNTYSAIENCDDKMMTYCLLSDNNIKIPSTISGIVNTGVENIKDISASERLKNYVEETLGYPLIAKKSDSKGGRDIYKIDNRTMLDEICDKLNGSRYLFQQFIPFNPGKDIRTVVVGGKYIGAIMRVNENDFRSNIKLGGNAFSYTVTEEYKEIAEKVANILNLDYCSVDFFLTDDNKPIICEVNADPAMSSFEKITGINVAKEFAEHVIKEIYD